MSRLFTFLYMFKAMCFADYVLSHMSQAYTLKLGPRKLPMAFQSVLILCTSPAQRNQLTSYLKVSVLDLYETRFVVLTHALSARG